MLKTPRKYITCSCMIECNLVSTHGLQNKLKHTLVLVNFLMHIGMQPKTVDASNI